MANRTVIGLIAGSGELPILFARQARTKGFDLVTAAVRGSASTRLNSLGGAILWVSPGQLGALITHFKKNNVKKIVMLGKIQHSLSFRNLKLDWKALALWAKLKDRSGESLLRAVAGELLKNGLRVLDSRFLMEGVLIRKGWVSKAGSGKPGPGEISYGLKQARALSRLGFGQAVMIKKNAVVSLEGMEGTDETIRRAGKWAGVGTILIKAASPKQDWRFDVPAIGLKTLKSLSAAKSKGLVVEGGRTFLLEGEKTIAYAKKHGIFILAV